MIRLVKKIIVLIILLMVMPLVVLPNEDRSDERLASQYFLNGEYEEAVVLYEELFEKRPTEVIYNNYLNCLIELKDYRRAERIIKSQIDRNPGQVIYEVDLGYVMLESGNERRGNRHLNSLINNVPEFPQGVITLAESFLNRGMLDFALKTYKAGRNKFENSHPFNIHIARLYEQKSDYENMMTEYVDLLSVSPGWKDELRGILQDVLNTDPDFKKNDALRKVLLQRSQRSITNTIYSEMLLWLSIQQKDFSMALRQARALDRRLQRDGEIVIEVADLSLTNKNFDIAEQAYNYIINLGPAISLYTEAKIGLLDVKYQWLVSLYDYDEKDIIEVEKAYEDALDEFGIHPHSVVIVRNLANIKAFYLGKSEDAVELLESVINMPRIPDRIKAECRIEMADILVLNGKVWDAKLLYSRVDKSYRNDPVGYEARYKNARLSYYMGEFDWAKAQLDILKASTSKFIANDAMALSLKIQDNIEFDGDTRPLEIFARAEQQTFMYRFDKALNILDSLHLEYPEHAINDNILFAKANIELKRGNYQRADSLLAELVRKYPAGVLADESLFKRAEINENIMRQTDTAKELYRQLIADYPASIYTHTARNRFRNLRGDLIN